MILLRELAGQQDDFHQMLLQSERSQNTIKKYSYAVRLFLSFAEENGHCGEISKDCLIEFKEYLVEAYKPATVNLYLTALNRFLCFNNLENLRIDTLRIQMQNSHENSLTPCEYKKLLRAAKNMDSPVYYVIRAITSTGIRVGELKYFTYENVKNRYCLISNKGKIRYIVIPSEVSTELLSYCKSEEITSGYIFRSDRTDGIISSVTIWRWMKDAAARAGVDPMKVYPHNLRHLFAKKFLDMYGNLSELADILGHARIETTRIYTRTSIDEKRRKLNRLSKNIAHGVNI